MRQEKKVIKHLNAGKHQLKLNTQLTVDVNVGNNTLRVRERHFSAAAKDHQFVRNGRRWLVSMPC